MNQKTEDWVHECYSVEKFRQAYRFNIHPIQDPIFWPAMDDVPLLAPPPLQKKRGRPPKDRRRGLEEGRKKRKRCNTMRCRTCKEIGHNSTTCPSNPNKKTIGKSKGKSTDKYGKKKPLGRPRKTSSALTISTLPHLQQLQPESSNTNKPASSKQLPTTRIQPTRSCKPTTPTKHTASKTMEGK